MHMALLVEGRSTKCELGKPCLFFCINDRLLKKQDRIQLPAMGGLGRMYQLDAWDAGRAADTPGEERRSDL